MRLSGARKRTSMISGNISFRTSLNTGSVFAYDFATNVIPGAHSYEEKGYWRDVGTVPAFFDAHMDMLGKEPL